MEWEAGFGVLGRGEIGRTVTPAYWQFLGNIFSNGINRAAIGRSGLSISFDRRRAASRTPGFFVWALDNLPPCTTCIVGHLREGRLHDD